MFLGWAKCNTLVLYFFFSFSFFGEFTLVFYFVNNRRTKEVMKRKIEEKKRADQIRMPETEKSVKTHLLWLPQLHHAYVALFL